MSIFVNTTTPNKLLQDIHKQIEECKIDTWSVNKDGDFTHNVDQWRFKAWLRPIVESDRLVFGILCRKDKNLSIVEYAVYHGRFIEMLLSHFDKECSSIESTALATSYDTINKSN